MKRLLCIVGSMNAGGAETFLMKIYRQLDKTKYQMDFAVAVQDKGFYDDEITSMGGKIFHITPKSDGIIKNFCSIKNLVKNESYKYVLRTSQHSLSALELLAAWMGGAKKRVFRSSNSNTTTGGGMDLILHKLCMFMPRMFANVRIAPSTEAAEFMFGKGCIERGEAIIIHNGVDLNIYCYSDIAREEVRKEFGGQDKIVIGHVGRFNQQKNHRKLIEIFNNLRNENLNSVLVLVGKGELESDVREQVKKLGLKDSIFFLGVRNDVPRIMSGMDIFVFPSLYEGMPNTVIEAQATGLPCVISENITKEAKITDLVEYLALSEDNMVWTKTILDLYKKSNRSNNRSSSIKDLKKQGYDITECVRCFEENIFF